MLMYIRMQEKGLQAETENVAEIVGMADLKQCKTNGKVIKKESVL